LRAFFYHALCVGMSSRKCSLDLTTVGVPAAADPNKKDASQKFFLRFEMKNETVLAKFKCSWNVSARLRVSGKVFVTQSVLAVFASVFGASFRFAVPLSSCVMTAVDAVTVKVEHNDCSMLLTLESSEALVRAKSEVKTDLVSSLPFFDNRSWDFLVTCGMRSVQLRQGEAAPPGELCWVARGQCVCRATGQIAPENSSFGDGSFFSGRASRPLLVEALSETAELLLFGSQFARILSAERPDVASNFYRVQSVVLANRLQAANPLVKCSISLVE
jgi:hypothetical protein